MSALHIDRSTVAKTLFLSFLQACSSLLHSWLAMFASCWWLLLLPHLLHILYIAEADWPVAYRPDCRVISGFWTYLPVSRSFILSSLTILNILTDFNSPSLSLSS